MANKETYIKQLQSWLGINEADGSDDMIIDIYNSQRLSGSYKMSYEDPWCHATISAAAYKAGCSSVIPNTAYCPDGINWFKARGQWVGRTYSNYSPQRGDIIYYDWGGDGVSDHVGAVVTRSGSTLTVIEGNKNDRCEYRYIDMWDTTIQGYGRPAYDGSNSGTVTNPEDRGWLQLGDTGNAVKEMQKMLNALGYTIDVDGEFGESTLAALKQFQTDNPPLVVDGEYGELSKAKLSALYKALNNNTNSGTDYIGKYVKVFESGSNGPTTIVQCGNDGGLSYGTYQFIWAYNGEPGSAQRFWNKYYASTYGKATSYTDLKTKWLKAVADDKKTFIDNEWTYVLNGGEYYSQMLDNLEGFFNPNVYSRSMQDCCWSWAVHRGGYQAATEFKKACSTYGISDPQTASESKLLDACYNYRWNNILFNGKKMDRYSPNAGADSEFVTMKGKLGLNPIDYITPSGKLINIVTDTPVDDTDDVETEEELVKWQKNWLKAVQKTLGLEQTGVYDESMLNYTPLMDLGYQGEIVIRVQNKLKHLQYTTKKADGKYGSTTKQLIKEYQKWHGLTENGIVGVETWRDLLSKRKGVK